MPSEVWASLIGLAGVCLTVMGTIYIWRKTSQQTEKAAHQTETVEADKTGIEGLRELAVQNRLDREEWRKERAQMIEERAEDRKRLDQLEREMATLRQERDADRRQIAELRTLKGQLLSYIHRLREFITGNGHTPPDPDPAIPLE